MYILNVNTWMYIGFFCQKTTRPRMNPGLDVRHMNDIFQNCIGQRKKNQNFDLHLI